MPNTADSIVSKASGKLEAAKARLHGLTGVFKTLCEQHGEAGALLRRVKADSEKRSDLWPKIRQELSSHEKGELAEVYPVLRQYDETRAYAENHDVEAKQLSSTIARIDSTAFDDPAWAELFDQLVEMVQQHVEEEESEIFPAAQKAIGDKRAKELEPRFLAAKKAAMAAG